MEVYVACIFDYFYEQSFLVGVFTTEAQAEDAVNIVIEQKKHTDPELCPEGRFSIDIFETKLDGFNTTLIDYLATESAP